MEAFVGGSGKADEVTCLTASDCTSNACNVEVRPRYICQVPVAPGSGVWGSRCISPESCNSKHYCKFQPEGPPSYICGSGVILPKLPSIKKLPRGTLCDPNGVTSICDAKFVCALNQGMCNPKGF